MSEGVARSNADPQSWRNSDEVLELCQFIFGDERATLTWQPALCGNRLRLGGDREVEV